MLLYRLVMKDDLGNLVFYPLNQQVNNIGRNHDNHVVLPESSVSKLHAVIRFVNDKPVIEDLGSLNGTFVNDRPINSPTELKDGDEIILGEYRLHVKSGSDQEGDSTLTKVHV